jgi:phosphate transport system permease protein
MTRSAPDKLLSFFSWACALCLTTALFIIIGFLVLKGYKALTPELIFGDVRFLDALLLKRQVFGGLFPAMAGTFFLILLSMALALPLGLASGIYLAEFAPSGTKRVLSFLFDILSGIPSIVVGLFGFSITIFLHHYFGGRIFPCLLISALSLAFLVLPYIIRTTQISLESLPLSLRLTAPALGATKARNIFYVLLPSSLSGIISGLILAMGRCAEDTAVIMLTGAVATAGIPKSVFSGFEALPFYIYYMASEYSGPPELMKAYGAALILLILCTVLFVFSHGIKHLLRAKTLYLPNSL